MENKEEAINVQHENTPSIPVTLTLMQTAYKFYTMKAMSCDINHPADFILDTTGKATYEEALMQIHSIIQNPSFDNVILPYEIPKLCMQLGTFDKIHSFHLRSKLRKKKRSEEGPNKELIRRLLIIYYNIVFDESLRTYTYKLFDQYHFDHQIVSLHVNEKGARTANGIMMYQGNECIECGSALNIVFRGTQNAKGSLAIAYHKTSAPKLCISYQKKCKKCDIYYNYNRIDYTDKTTARDKRNHTLLLDPEAFEFYSISGKASQNYIHRSIYNSIRNHQYCNKPQSIMTWIEHYNFDWKHEYDKLAEIKNIHAILSSVELGYASTLRYFYFFALLCRLRDMEDYGSIIVNNKKIKIALKITDEDKIAIKKDKTILDDIKNNTKANNQDKEQEKEVRGSVDYFRCYMRKYYKRLIATAVKELKQVPVRIGPSGKIEIYPGWFIVYGDGGEKINRLRCAYPAILSKLDYMLKLLENGEYEKAKASNDVEKDDDDIDLVINNDAKKYSAQRYYECEASPYFNDKNNDRKSYKCCKHHIAKMVDHGMELADITKFISWYQIHATLAKMTNTDVAKTIKATYSITDESLKSINTKHKKRQNDLEAKSIAFAKDNPELQQKFMKFVDDIHKKVNNFRKRAHLDRKCKEIGKAKTDGNVVGDKQQELYDKLRNILGDYDFDTDVVDEIVNANTTSIIDLLNLEFNYDKYMDKYKGCRKVKNITGAVTAKTKGLNVLMNCSGIIIKLREEIVRETPTAVILDIAESCTNNKTLLNYANRIEAIGYDMICRIYHHLKALVKNERLSPEYEVFWCDMINRAFVDIWHILHHTDELCQENGTFHPKLPKFQHILYNINQLMDRVNDIIAEQFWATMNATTQLKAMTQEKFTLFLLEKRDYHNQAKYDDIKKDGWTFIPIEWFTIIRDIKKAAKSEVTLPSEIKLKEENNVKLRKVEIKADKMQDVRRLIVKAKTIPNSDVNKNKRRARKRKASDINQDENCDCDHNATSKRRKAN